MDYPYCTFGYLDKKFLHLSFFIIFSSLFLLIICKFIMGMKFFPSHISLIALFHYHQGYYISLFLLLLSSFLKFSFLYPQDYHVQLSFFSFCIFKTVFFPSSLRLSHLSFFLLLSSFFKCSFYLSSRLSHLIT